jgi:hypothetical protein
VKTLPLPGIEQIPKTAIVPTSEFRTAEMLALLKTIKGEDKFFPVLK